LAGRFFHRPLIQATDGLSLTHVVTADPVRRSDAAAEVPTGTIVDTLEALWEQADYFDVVVIATANSSHASIAAEALARDKSVVVEKPLAVTAAEAQALADRAARTGRLLTVFHNRRWDSDTLTVKRLMRDGALGDVHRFESRFQRFRPGVQRRWREDDPARGGGVLLDLGTHLIDQAVHLFGPVETVYAEIDVRRPGAVADDDDFIALQHAGGVRSHLWCSMAAPAPGPRVRVDGSVAGYVKETLDGQEDALRAGWDPASGPWGVEPPGTLSDGAGSRAYPSEPGAWTGFYRQFVAALQGAARVPVPVAEAVSVLALIEAARRSAHSRSVIRVTGT
jgi:predicted dehydrogenase